MQTARIAQVAAFSGLFGIRTPLGRRFNFAVVVRAEFWLESKMGRLEKNSGK